MKAGTAPARTHRVSSRRSDGHLQNALLVDGIFPTHGSSLSERELEVEAEKNQHFHRDISSKHVRSSALARQ